MKNIPMDEIELDALKSAVDLSLCTQREVCTWNKYVPCTKKLKTFLSGYHADTPITIKAEAIHEADSRIH